MRISEAAERLGVSADTLRYYEKIGLLRDIDRVGGRRSFGAKDIAWLEFIRRLKETGMELKMIKAYSDMRHQGDATLSQRKAMLLDHRQGLEQRIKALEAHLRALDKKITWYETKEEEHALRTRTG